MSYLWPLIQSELKELLGTRKTWISNLFDIEINESRQLYQTQARQVKRYKRFPCPFKKILGCNGKLVSTADARSHGPEHFVIVYPGQAYPGDHGKNLIEVSIKKIEIFTLSQVKTPVNLYQ